VLIVSLIFFGSMYHVNNNMIPAEALMDMRGG
jgi:hypothetical protein